MQRKFRKSLRFVFIAIQNKKNLFHGIKYENQIDLEFEDNTFQIYEGFQGEIYSYEAWLNIPVSGEIYLKAYDLLSNTELSSWSLSLMNSKTFRRLLYNGWMDEIIK